MPKFNKETASNWGRVGGTIRTSRGDPSALARTGQRGLLQRFEREVDPTGSLDPAERTKRALRLRKAHMLRLSIFASRARAAKAQAAREAREASGG